MRRKSQNEHPNSVIGPIVGGFVVQNIHLNWRFNFWLMFVFSAMSLITGYFFTPETVRQKQSFQVQPFDSSL